MNTWLEQHSQLHWQIIYEDSPSSSPADSSSADSSFLAASDFLGRPRPRPPAGFFSGTGSLRIHAKQFHIVDEPTLALVAAAPPAFLPDPLGRPRPRFT